jgi:hypothetical protein
MKTGDARVVPNSIERMSNVGKRTSACASEDVDTFPNEATGEAGVAPDTRLGYRFHHAPSLRVTFYLVGGVGDDYAGSIDLGGCFA